MKSWCAVLLWLIACKNTNEEQQPAPRPPRDAAVSVDTQVVIPVPQDAAPLPYRRVIDESYSPMNMIVVGDNVWWTDSRGEMWVKSWHPGAAPTRKIDTGGRVMFLGEHEGKVLATLDKDLIEVAPQGAPKPLGLELPETVLEMASGGGSLYVTIYNQPRVFKIVGTKPVPVLPGYSVAVHGGHVYASSYGGGTLVTRPLAGGATRTLATKLPKPTGLAADDTHAFVWCESDQTLRKIDVKTGAMTSIKQGTDNSDTIVSDGDWIYLGDWGEPARLLRVKKDGSKTETIADDLQVPYNIDVDETGVFVADRDANQIIRFEKAMIPP